MKYLMFLSFCLTLLTACNEDGLTTEDDKPCPEMVCTQEFRTVEVIFKDASGAAINVNNFSSVIRRTGREPHSGAVDLVNAKGRYNVVTDGDILHLSAGDIIDVSAVNPSTNQTKTAQFVVSGGKCACHINKISGPTEIRFD